MILLSVAIAAFAATCSFSDCNLPVNISEFKGFSNMEITTHKYGGFLGIGQQICTISTQYAIYYEYCANGHLNNVRKIVYQQSHSSCGQ